MSILYVPTIDIMEDATLAWENLLTGSYACENTSHIHITKNFKAQLPSLYSEI